MMVPESVPAVTNYSFGSHPRPVFSISYPLGGFFHNCDSASLARYGLV